MHDLLDRDHWVWSVASIVLFVTAVVGVATEAGPTAVVAAALVAVTLYASRVGRDERRLLLASGCFLALGLASSLTPTGPGCGSPIIESAKHSTEPTPHIHGPCEQANDRRALGGLVLVIGSGVTLLAARRRRP